MIYLSFVLLIFSLILLGISGELSVKYSRLISDSLGMSTLFIGFAVIAISTGLPELLVALHSIIIKKPNLSLGDIIGSNFFDVSLVLGLPTLFINQIMVDQSIYKNSLILVLSSIFLMSLVFLLKNLMPFHGLILIAVHFILLWFIWKSDRTIKRDNIIFTSKIGLLSNFIKLFLALCGLFVASRVAVVNSNKIAQYFSLSLVKIGSTILAIGTSLPELVLSVVSVRRKEYALAIGNSFGSVLEQGGLILGILAVASPKPLSVTMLQPIIPFMFSSYFLVLFAFVLKKRLDRIDGLILILITIAFLVYQYF